MPRLEDYEFASRGMQSIGNALLNRRLLQQQDEERQRRAAMDSQMMDLRRNQAAAQERYQQGMVDWRNSQQKRLEDVAKTKATDQAAVDAGLKALMGDLSTAMKGAEQEQVQYNETGEIIGTQKTPSAQTAAERAGRALDAFARHPTALKHPVAQKLLQEGFQNTFKAMTASEQPDLPEGFVPTRASESATGRRVEYGPPPKEYTEVDRETAGRFGWLIDNKGEWHLKHETKQKEDLTKAQQLTGLQRIITEANRVLRDDPDNRAVQGQKLEANKRMWEILQGGQSPTAVPPAKPAAPAAAPDELRTPGGDELSVGRRLSWTVAFDGWDPKMPTRVQEREIPLLVPGLTSDEINYLRRGGEPTPAIVLKAVDHARKRLMEGRSVWDGGEPQKSPAKPAAPAGQRRGVYNFETGRIEWK